jgi:hypothetical protein
MERGMLNATSAGNGGGRAFRPGRRWLFALAAVVVVVVAGGLVLVLSPGRQTKYPAQDLSYGSLPSWLPKSAREPAADKPQMEVATAAKPILSEEQGYTVHAELPGGTADVTAVGPSVPGYVTRYAESGVWPAGKQVPSTFSVTFADVKGTIPVSAGAFQVEDAQYHHFGASLSMTNKSSVPAVVRTGQTVTVVVHTETTEGQGAIAWNPVGNKTLIAWIYQLELD